MVGLSQVHYTEPDTMSAWVGPATSYMKPWDG